MTAAGAKVAEAELTLEEIQDRFAAKVEAAALVPVYDGAPLDADLPERTRQLLGQIERFIGRYVVLPDSSCALLLSLWVLHTWAFEAAHATPYIVVLSPEKRSGKTRLLEVLELLVREPWRVVSASAAVVARKIERDCPTLLLDEIDAIFAGKEEYQEALRGVLNAGNRRGATYDRCDGKGQELKSFSTFCPKVLGGIDNGRLPDTIRDRAMEVRMQRKLPGQEVQRFRHREAQEQVGPLRESLEAWTHAANHALEPARPMLPDELDDRAQDSWEPLLAVAELAGQGCAERARAAASTVSGDRDADEEANGTRVLKALRTVLHDRDAATTAEVLEKLNGYETLPFGAWRDGRGLDGRGLARILKPYGVKPGTIRVDEATLKGYRSEWLEDAWRRYLPADPAGCDAVTLVTAQAGDSAREAGDDLAARAERVAGDYPELAA